MQFDKFGRPIRVGENKRRTLREAGYAVDRHGPLTPRLLSAWQDYNSHGGHPKHWNARNPSKATRSATYGPSVPKRPLSAAGQAAAKAASGIAGAVRGGLKHKKVVPPISPHPKKRDTHDRAAAAAQDLGAQTDGTVGNNFPGVPPVDAGGTNTASLLPRGMADTLAGYQFDPQIHELLSQLEQGKRDSSQHQSDIGNWYGQVAGAQDTARTRDTEAAQHAQGDVTGTLQSILQSLGGSRGAGVVGAAGLNDLTGLASQGASQDRYNADLAPLLKQEEAGAHSRQSAQDSQTANQRHQQLVELRGQRGQGVGKALVDIMQANNQGRQTNFQNRLAVQNAKLAGASLGLNADQTYAGIDAQKAATRQNERKLTLAEQQASGRPNWAKLNYPDRQTVVHDAVDRAASTMAPDHWDALYVRGQALKIIRAGGYSSARGPGYKGKVNLQSRRQIQAAVDAAVQSAYQAWKAKQ